MQRPRQLLGLAVFVAIVMGIGAVVGAMDTMYALLAARTREIGTLRALGFSKVSILTMFVVESTCLAIVRGALGWLLTLPADCMTAAATGTNFGEIGFAFRISATSLAHGPTESGLDRDSQLRAGGESWTRRSAESTSSRWRLPPPPNALCNATSLGR